MYEIADPRFVARMGAHIELSNQQAREASVDKVALSMLDASCRYNVWLWAASSPDVTAFQAQRAEALEAVLAETRARFDKHFDDHVKNFGPYVVAQRSGDTQQS